MTRTNRKGQEVPYRVSSCLWATGWSKAGMGPRITKTAASSTWRGLQICASIWHCPVCAARISNERRKDIAAAINAAAKRGFKAVLVTYTARHDATTDLRGQLKAMTKAYEAVWRGEPAKRLKARYGILGVIRSLEATHSKRNGWHPHIHAIVFVNQYADMIMYPCLRVEFPEIKEDLLRSVPPCIIPPASVETANLQVESHLSSWQAAKGHGLAKFAPEFAIGAL